VFPWVHRAAAAYRAGHSRCMPAERPSLFQQQQRGRLRHCARVRRKYRRRYAVRNGFGWSVIEKESRPTDPGRRSSEDLRDSRRTCGIHAIIPGPVTFGVSAFGVIGGPAGTRLNPRTPFGGFAPGSTSRTHRRSCWFETAIDSAQRRLRQWLPFIEPGRKKRRQCC